MLGKQPCKDSGQSVPDWKFDFRFRLIAFFLLVLQVRARAKEKTGKNMIWDTLAFNPDDMRYSCSGMACLQRYYQGEKKLSILRDSTESALSDVKKS
ncbi:hypothetical protein ACFX1Z_007335 [Malus domestica]